MTTAIIGTGGIGSAIAVSLLPGARPSSSRAPTRSRRESWPPQSAERRSSRSTTGALCREPMPSSLRCGFPC